jgi:hypothetical protein
MDVPVRVLASESGDCDALPPASVAASLALIALAVASLVLHTALHIPGQQKRQHGCIRQSGHAHARAQLVNDQTISHELNLHSRACVRPHAACVLVYSRTDFSSSLFFFPLKIQLHILLRRDKLPMTPRVLAFHFLCFVYIRNMKTKGYSLPPIGKYVSIT